MATLELTKQRKIAQPAAEQEDPFFTPEMLAEIDRRYADYLAGRTKFIKCRTDEELRNFLDSL